MAVSFHNEDITYKLTRKILHKNWIAACIGKLGKKAGAISFIFTSNPRILQLNREYLQHNYFTDVITFDYSDENLLSGDIFISIDQVKINALEYGVGVSAELRRVMVHGVLHLAGFKDSTEKEKDIMHELENDALTLWLKWDKNDAGI